MRKKINIAVIAILISTLTTSGIATGSQAIKVKAGTLDSRIEGDGEALVTDEGDVMVPEGSGDGHDVEVDPAEYYGYTGEENTGVLEKEEKVAKKESKDKKVKKGKKKKVVVKKGVVKKKEEQAKKAEEAKKKAEETKKKDNKNGNKKYADENEAMRKSLLGVKGKVLARDDEYGAPLVIQQGDRLLLSDWQKKLDAHYGIVRDAKGWRLYSPDRGICPDHAFDNNYDKYCEYRQEEIDKQIKWQKEHRDE